MVEAAIESSLNIRRAKQNKAVCKWESIPKALRTEERLNRFVEIDGRVIKFLEKQEISKEQLQQAIQSKPQSINEMDLDTLDEGLIILAMSLDGMLLREIPLHCRTTPVVNQAIIQNGEVVRFIDHLTDEQVDLIVEHHPDCLRHVKQEIPLHLVKQAIKRSAFAFNSQKFLAHRALIPIFMSELIRQRNVVYSGNYQELRGTNDMEVLKELQTILAKDLGRMELSYSFSNCLLALSSPCEGSDYYLRTLNQMFDHGKRTEEETKWLIKTFLLDLNYSEKVRRDGIKAKRKQELLKEDGLNLRIFSLEQQTQKMALLALAQNPAALKYVRPKFKTYRLCRSLVQTNPEIAIYSPYHVEDEAYERLKQTKFNPFY